MYKKLMLIVGFSLMMSACNGMVLENFVYVCNTSSDCPDSQNCSGRFGFDSGSYAVENGYYGVCSGVATGEEICDNGKSDTSEKLADCLNPSCRNSPYCMAKCDGNDECSGWFEYFSDCSTGVANCEASHGECVTVNDGANTKSICFPKCIKNINEDEDISLRADNYCDNFNNTEYDDTEVIFPSDTVYKCVVYDLGMGSQPGVCVPDISSSDCNLVFTQSSDTEPQLSEVITYCLP
jgi:hypothetical protein